MITLRILFDEEIINEDVLTNHIINGEVLGYKLNTWPIHYSELPVYSIEKFKLFIDGKIADESAITFCLDSKCFNITQLPELYMKYWYSIEEAELVVNIPGGLAEGNHKIDLKFELKRQWLPEISFNCNMLCSLI